MAESEPTGRFGEWPWPARIALVVIGALMTTMFLSYFLDVGTEPERDAGDRGASGSTLSTGSAGWAAYAELLRRSGIEVDRTRRDIDGIDPSHAVFVNNASSLSSAEVLDFEQLAIRGARVVFVGAPPDHLAQVPVWRSTGPIVVGAGPLYEDETLSTLGDGSFTSLRSTDAVAGEAGSMIISERPSGYGQGEFVFVATSSVFDNTYLDAGANAAVGIELVEGRPTTFVERSSVRATGWSAIPSRFRTALIGLLASLVLYGWSRGRRFGPIETPHREFDPPRVAYVEALAATLARTGSAPVNPTSGQEVNRS